MEKLVETIGYTLILWVGFGAGYYFGQAKMKRKFLFVIVFFVITSYQIWRLIL